MITISQLVGIDRAEWHEVETRNSECPRVEGVYHLIFEGGGMFGKFCQ